MVLCSVLVFSLLGIAFAKNSPIKVVANASSGAGPPVLDAFVSYSIEFAFFPDFAGILPPICTYDLSLRRTRQSLESKSFLK